MTHPSVQHDSFVSVAWFFHKCDVTYACHTTYPYAMPRSYVWHDAFMCMTWRIHVWHDVFMCDMMYTCMTRDLFSDVTSPTAVNDLHVWVTWLTLMYNMPHYCMHTCEHAHTHKHTHTQAHARTHAHSHTHTGTHTHTTIREIRLYCLNWNHYGVATISRLLKMIGLFCRISSL